MIILFVLARSINPLNGGVQRITFNLGEFFSRKGLHVSYYSLQCHDKFDGVNGRVHYLPQRGGLKNQRNRAHFLKTLDDIRPDIVINQMPYLIDVNRLLFKHRRAYNYRIFSCIHSSLFNYKDRIEHVVRSTGILRRFPTIVLEGMTKALKVIHFISHRRALREMLNLCDRLIVYTPENISELKYFTGDYQISKVIDVPNPVSLRLVKKSAKENVILHVGTINIQQKRSDLLPRFWGMVYRDLPHWKFVIVGDGPYLEELKRTFETLKIDRVEFVGRVAPDDYYESASLFMMPSAYEGFPNTIIEAQYYGCPVLAFKTYAALEFIVNDGLDALLSPPYDVAKMARDAMALARDPDRLTRMRTAAVENVNRFTIEKVGQKWMDLFEWTLTPSAPHP